ncbi:MAG TPA: carboxypeptidase-like regulatory domain-containing protein, partial [Candidatus Saccharimonadales bacterium]|nr:carboxypeptidase-like regulatory domain-containing protein [Candidatus Saccharimonadales bacterium]
MAQTASKLSLTVLLCALLPLSLLGQSVQGTLLIAVEDSAGGRIAGAGVIVTLTKAALSRSATTNERGEVRFEALPPGMYSIAVRASGFEEKTSRVAVSVSSQATFAVILGPQTLKQTVQVRDRGPSLASQPVETTSSTINTVVTTEDLDEIPLSARSFANIAYLAPFTAPVEPSDPTKARITAVSFGGSSGLNVDL